MIFIIFSTWALFYSSETFRERVPESEIMLPFSEINGKSKEINLAKKKVK